LLLAPPILLEEACGKCSRIREVEVEVEVVLEGAQK